MRSTPAASLAKDMGYTRAEVLFAGLVAWKEAGLPTDKA
jgi:rhodanese-related sulfurtransferase